MKLLLSYNAELWICCMISSILYSNSIDNKEYLKELIITTLVNNKESLTDINAKDKEINEYVEYLINKCNPKNNEFLHTFNDKKDK